MTSDCLIPNPRSLIPLLFLIGYRCTGKTTVAQLLAERLGWKWLDADAEEPTSPFHVERQTRPPHAGVN